MSLFKYLDLPVAFGATLLTFSVVLTAFPYFAGADFGVFKLPAITPRGRRMLLITGPIVLLTTLLLFVPLRALDPKTMTVTFTAASHPQVTFSQIPGVRGGQISGSVSSLRDPEKYRVVVYAWTDAWYVQPTEGPQALAVIHSDGSWNNWTYPGSRFAVLVVLSTYAPPSKYDTPPVTGQDVLAFAIVPAAKDKTP